MPNITELLAKSLAYIHPNTRKLLLDNIQDQQKKLDKSNPSHDHISPQNLSESEPRQFLFNEYKHNVAHLIQEPHSLNLIFQFLSDQERKLLFQQEKDNITNLIKTSYDLNLILQFLPDEERKLLFQQKKDDITNLIKTSHDLYFTLRFLLKINEKLSSRKKKKI